MKPKKSTHAIVLAAGYATRLYPLTLTHPKPLLPVAGKPILEYIVDDLSSISDIDTIYVVGNQKFAPEFERWLKDYKKPNVVFVNDGSTDEATKLGAIGNLEMALRKENIDGDILVIAGDNLLGESLKGFIKASRAKDTVVIGAHEISPLELVKKFGAISVDDKGQVTAFEEKPEHPKTNLISIALYYYPEAIVPLIHKYIAEGNNPDQPGRLIEWLYKKIPVHTWKTKDVWFDIGSKELLEEADRVFTERKKKSSKKTSG